MNEELLFAAAVELSDPAERRAFLDRECGGDAALRGRGERLLAADAQTASFLSHGAAAAVEPAGLAPLAAGAGLAGRFQLRPQLRPRGLGQGPAAARLEPVRRRIALKLIRPGFDSAGLLTRFEQERQALALMDHPGIARILDAGTTEDGRPYFVMELILGVPITDYCDANKLTPRGRPGACPDAFPAV